MYAYCLSVPISLWENVKQNNLEQMDYNVSAIEYELVVEKERTVNKGDKAKAIDNSDVGEETKISSD